MVTDPPYGVSYDPEWREECGRNDSDNLGKVRNDDRVDWTESYRNFPGHVAYVWHAGRFAAGSSSAGTSRLSAVSYRVIGPSW